MAKCAWLTAPKKEANRILDALVYRRNQAFTPTSLFFISKIACFAGGSVTWYERDSCSQNGRHGRQRIVRGPSCFLSQSMGGNDHKQT